MGTLKKYAKKYFIDAMSAMALGLFASLLIGTIFGVIIIPALFVVFQSIQEKISSKKPVVSNETHLGFNHEKYINKT